MKKCLSIFEFRLRLLENRNNSSLDGCEPFSHKANLKNAFLTIEIGCYLLWSDISATLWILSNSSCLLYTRRASLYVCLGDEQWCSITLDKQKIRTKEITSDVQWKEEVSLLVRSLQFDKVSWKLRGTSLFKNLLRFTFENPILCKIYINPIKIPSFCFWSNLRQGLVAGTRVYVRPWLDRNIKSWKIPR